MCLVGWSSPTGGASANWGEAVVAFQPGSIQVNRNSPVPLYFQVAQELERAIDENRLQPGDQLDNELLLADQLGLSRPTMRRALQYLVDKGYLVRRRGIGTQVVHRKVRRPIELTSLYDDLESSGQKPTTTVLSLIEVAASDTVAHELDVPEGSPVLFIERLRYAGGEPLALMRNYLPRQLLDINEEDLERKGLYPLLRAAGLRPSLASQRVGARPATPAEAKLLGERKGACLLTMSRTAYDANGRALELGDHLYRAAMYSFEFALSAR